LTLTVKKIAKLKKPGRYIDQRGLYLQVLSPTNRNWILRWERNGRERRMGLGPVDVYTLDEARERAREAHKLIREGIDPIEARRAKRAAEEARALTFKDATQQYFDLHSKQWSARHRVQFFNSLKDHAFPVLGRMPVATIETEHVLKCLGRLWHEKNATASHVRQRIEIVLGWATVRGFRTGNNPAAWKGHLAAELPKPSSVAPVKHHAALPYSEVSAFMATLRERDTVAARALEFTILTAARTSEVYGATWDEIDLAAKTWTVPARRMKTRKEHKVPLAPAALALLRSLPRDKANPFVFPGPRGSALSKTTMDVVLASMGFKGERHITVHGFRSAFRDWASEMTGHPRDVVEMALAHAIGNAVEAAYRRGDLFEKRTRLMADWAGYCEAKSAAVVALRR